MKKILWTFIALAGAYLAHSILHFFLNPNYINKGFFSSDLLSVLSIVIFYLIARVGWRNDNLPTNLLGENRLNSNTEIFSSYVTLILKYTNMPNTDANRLKATVYLCFAQMACLHVLSKGATAVFMDAMVEDVKKSTLSLKMKVKDLAKSQVELKNILSEFPQQAEVDGDTTVNGLAAFEAIYFQYVKAVVTDIASNTDGPMGANGYATVKLLEALKGKGNPNVVDGMVEVSVMMSDMTGEVIKAFR
jgi:hypothetical protein